MKTQFLLKHLPLLIGTLFTLNAQVAAADAVDKPTEAALTWANDIQPIMTKSCGLCHTSASAAGLIILETEDQVLKRIAAIKSVVSGGSMPPSDPEFAGSTEGKTLLIWLTTQAELQLTWDKDIKPIVAAQCSWCHGAVQPAAGLVLETEAQILKANKAIAEIVIKGKMPVGNPDFAKSVEGQSLLTWLKIQAMPSPSTAYLRIIKPIITTNCLSCHSVNNAAGGFAFDAEADLVKNSMAIAAVVTSGAMPIGDVKFKESADAKTLLDWIKSLKPTGVPAI